MKRAAVLLALGAGLHRRRHMSPFIVMKVGQHNGPDPPPLSWRAFPVPAARLFGKAFGVVAPHPGTVAMDAVATLFVIPLFRPI